MHDPLPVHPILRHPLTGRPLIAAGVLSSGRVVWPIMGASEAPPEGGEGGDAAADAAKAAAEKAAAEKAAVEKAAADAKKGSEPKPGDPFVDEDGEKFEFPYKTPLSDMKPAEQTEYWRHKAKKHENENKKFGGMTPAEIADLKRKSDEYDASKMSASEKAVADAKAEGRKEALAESLTATVSTLMDAHMIAAGVDKDTPEGKDVAETLAALNASTFISEDHVDAVKLSKVLNRLVPLSGASSSGWPATGQGNRNTGAGSARDAGKAEAERRFPKKEDATK